ncbi:MAG: aminotransferase class III-fold pyridoxal phosphate-dependent enzyme [Desulfobacterales bacterium]|nr:aminotransferase class III-fold pyridoxal phosphate-dependent enzyme [Desulfobacterales bacterium]
MEPIQGEAGAIVPPDDFWPRIREATKKYGTLLIADEVQTGLGRTGKLWGVDHWDVVPDIIAVAKSLGGGVMPICAVITTEEIFQPFMYPEPLPANHHHRRRRAGLLGGDCGDQRHRARQAVGSGKGKGRLHHAQGARNWRRSIRRSTRAVTGKGLLIGQHFQTPEIGGQVAADLFKRGVLVAGTLTSAQTIRIEPPLVITYDEINQGLAALTEAVTEVAGTL